MTRTKKSGKPFSLSETICSSVPEEELEVHSKVLTEDGYLLTLVRLKEDKALSENEEKTRTPVLLLTGLFNGGTEWLVNPAARNLPLILRGQGYDCWMGCFRGTPLSLQHTTLKTSSKKFWDFSVDELSKYDVPAFIDYILNTTGHKDLFYVGYSMGGAAIMATLNIWPEYSSKVRAIVALSPAVYGFQFKTKLNKIGIPAIARMATSSKFIYRRPVGSTTIAETSKKIIPSCTGINRDKLSSFFISTFGNLGGTYLTGCRTDPQSLPLIAQVFPCSTSIKQGSHIAQVFNSKKFRAFNYGRKGNLKNYGEPKPPMYDLSKVTVPVATFASKYDYVVAAECVGKTAAELPNLVKHYIIVSPKFAHCDYLFGKDLEKILFPSILEVFRKFPTSSNSDTIISTCSSNENETKASA